MNQIRHFVGTYSNFKCAQCQKTKEFPIGATVASWSPALKREGKCLCSLSCARAWDREHKGKRKSCVRGIPYTEEDNELITQMRLEGRPWQEIADTLGRTTKAVEHHYNTFIKSEAR